MLENRFISEVCDCAAATGSNTELRSGKYDKGKKKRSYDTHLGQQVTTVSVTEPAMFILLQADVYPRGQMPGE